MNDLCHNCTLNYSIEHCRETLNNIIVEKEYNLLEDEVINKSQLLDDLITECVFCENNLVIL
ncbi:hypothetical protein psyc5s11_49570 [Clostridium gelidum]|uniref:Uncharacterized protein n=1 Tax=Clostridium gelidum TaxID=704125 RepID=A0ABN6J5Q3_9CLOT|nr:aspartyl-phosphate phosphatase Spo0E family protein [Clostridium gelidum]BCZ48890.1 hypothetical protein psyc5s11_49570 [Clostridium gelidum]